MCRGKLYHGFHTDLYTVSSSALLARLAQDWSLTVPVLRNFCGAGVMEVGGALVR